MALGIKRPKMTGLSIAGEGAEWDVFARRSHAGSRVVVRSRLRQQSLREFAEANFLSRLRLVMRPCDVNETGMPVSTEALDQFEDFVIGELEQAAARTYQIAVVTGDGNRDLYFAAHDGAELLDAVRKAVGPHSFNIELARVNGSKEALLNSLTASAH